MSESSGRHKERTGCFNLPARCKHKLKFVWRRTIPIADTYYFKCDICGMGKYIEVARFWKVPLKVVFEGDEASYLERLLGRKPTEKDLEMRDAALKSIVSRSQPETVEEGIPALLKHFGMSDERVNDFRGALGRRNLGRENQEALDRNEIYRAGFTSFKPDRSTDYPIDYDRDRYSEEDEDGR